MYYGQNRGYREPGAPDRSRKVEAGWSDKKADDSTCWHSSLCYGSTCIRSTLFDSSPTAARQPGGRAERRKGGRAEGSDVVISIIFSGRGVMLPPPYPKKLFNGMLLGARPKWDFVFGVSPRSASAEATLRRRCGYLGDFLLTLSATNLMPRCGEGNYDLRFTNYIFEIEMESKNEKVGAKKDDAFIANSTS
jgi:hypothetical protein